MKSLLQYLKPYKKLLIIGPSFKLLEAVLELMLPFLMSKAVDYGVARGDRAYIARTGGLMLLIAAVGICCALICQYVASLVSQGVGTDIRNAMFEKTGALSQSQLESIGAASLVNRITNDVNQVQQAVAMLIRLVIRAPFLCVGGLVMAFLIDVKMSFILVAALPIFIFILFLTMKKTVPLYRKVQARLDRIALVLRESLSGVRVIRAFSKSGYEEARFEAENSDYEEHAIRVGRISALLNPLTSLVMNFAVGAILWYGGIRVDRGVTTTGDVIAFIGYVAQILTALIVMSNLVTIFTRAFASAGRLAQVLTLEPDMTAPVQSKAKPGNSKAAVEFRHVFMKYEAEGGYSLEDISFRAEKGQTIGIIGPTGSGKSTVVSLIPRFYDAAKGEVLVDGVDVRDYALSRLRLKIGLAPQKAVLFSGTVEENIRWGREDASEEDIRRAVSIAQAQEFIQKLPEGFGTYIRRGGSNVSGGQRQRLTIARALVRKPEILILDDSFSALDLATDAALRKALREECGEMTTFLVSQRAGAIKNADLILVLHEGKLAGAGTHEQLYASCGIYREICESQEQSQAG